MRLNRLELHHFRNYAHLALDLEAPRLLVIGANGAGKSNLLEAVELLGSLRSHRTASDQDLILHGQPVARIVAHCGEGSQPGPGASRPDEDRLELELRRRGGRLARRNGKALERQHDLIGPLRVVGFSALDLDLVRGEPALRRQWLDRVVLQLEPVYSELLRRYGRLLRQRTHLLKRGGGGGHQPGLLDAFDQQMALVGTRLHRRRQRALGRLAPLATGWQQRLSGGREALELAYQAGSRLEGAEEEAPWREALAEQLRQQRDEELRLGHCLVGPHRDEIGFLLGGQPARRYGSAGQQRTLVLALKLAELELVRQLWGQPPLLLLDDVLAELDAQRQQLLLEAIGEGHQCLISATHVEAFSAGWAARSQRVRVVEGALIPIPARDA
ncbi:DNA replication/repair protein RecF [Synechococcus sp. Tobar12-5m-g]|uniref:DNA replication/repair protein RecF n=1 Tax=unclassified Synechococcus TaxID=2626047 RepID=UPI0020CF2AF6|nr:MULTISPECIES: DNA replication/repair protein RecF [unclassified Synechococcus]MCP9772991.1 DNA replication/repair protein RecF [Synechococcus sp. Tobar12-5m-g]MCP9873860.1 DNA replication/repair protein RecF [Synechococcus sp. Cruz CV-v-12]